METPGTVLESLRNRRNWSRTVFALKMQKAGLDRWTAIYVKALENADCRFTDDELRDLVSAAIIREGDVFYNRFVYAMDYICGVVRPFPVAVKLTKSGMEFIIDSTIVVSLNLHSLVE